MKFTLLDANDNEIGTVETLALADAKEKFSEQLEHRYNWHPVTHWADDEYDVKIKDDKDRTTLFRLELK